MVSTSAFSFQYLLLSWRWACSFLRLLPRLRIISMLPSIFPSLTCSRRQFLYKVWPTQLAFILFYLECSFRPRLCHTSLFTGSAQLITAVIVIIKYLINVGIVLSRYVPPCNLLCLCHCFLRILNNSLIFWIINFTFLPSVRVTRVAHSAVANIKSLYKLGLYEVSGPRWRHHIAQNCAVSEQENITQIGTTVSVLA